MRSPGCHRDEQRTGRRSGEWGFTLPELLATIVIIGVIAAIAIPSFFGLIEARRVESAANQLASDLRLAHSRATNQVGTPWAVALVPGRKGESEGEDYFLINTIEAADDPDYEPDSRTLPDNTKIENIDLVTDSPTLLSSLGLPTTKSTFYFCSGGNVRWNTVSNLLTSSACSETTSLSSEDITVSSGGNQRTIKILPATSNVEVSDV